MSSINMVLKDTVVNRTGHCLNNWSLEITFTLAKFHKNVPKGFVKIFIYVSIQKPNLMSGRKALNNLPPVQILNKSLTLYWGFRI